MRGYVISAIIVIGSAPSFFKTNFLPFLRALSLRSISARLTSRSLFLSTLQKATPSIPAPLQISITLMLFLLYEKFLKPGMSNELLHNL